MIRPWALAAADGATEDAAWRYAVALESDEWREDVFTTALVRRRLWVREAHHPALGMELGM